MTVDVCGHLDVRVSQPLLHVFQAVALRQQHAGAGVAQVVKPDMGQVVLLQQLVEGVAHIVGGVGVPVLPGEHIVVVYVVLAEVVSLNLFLLKQDLEQPHRIICQGKAAEAGCVLRLVLLHDLRDPGHGVPYGQRCIAVTMHSMDKNKRANGIHMARIKFKSRCAAERITSSRSRAASGCSRCSQSRKMV